MRSKRLMTAPWLALASFAAYNILESDEGVPRKGGARTQTLRRTPIPIKITLAGGKAFTSNVNIHLESMFIIRTRLTPSPRASEKVESTWINGSIHLISF